MMKLQWRQLLPAVTVVFIVFLVGVFWGRSSTQQHLLSNGSNNTTASAPQESYDLEDTRSFIDGKLNINAASVEELTLLPGIGDTIAQWIIDYRITNGPFASVDDLTNVNGISQSKLHQIIDYITIGG